MKVVWTINNASKNFRGGEMLNVNSVIDRGGGGHHPPHLARLPDVALIRVKTLLI